MQVTAGGRRWTFVSGTAAIKGHGTVCAGDLAGQIACTLDNMRLVSRECGLGDAVIRRLLDPASVENTAPPLPAPSEHEAGQEARP
jgi:hypothetical protein